MRDVGAKIHRLADLKLHAKAIIADGERAIVGSINLSPGSFDDRRAAPRSRLRGSTCSNASTR